MDKAVEIAVGHDAEIAVEIAMASAMGRHGIPRHAAAVRGSPWHARGSPWRVRGSPWRVRGSSWKSVEIAVECRGGPGHCRRGVQPKSKKTYIPVCPGFVLFCFKLVTNV